MSRNEERGILRRTWRWSILLLLAFALIVFAGVRLSPKSGIQKQVQAIRKAGLPTSTGELNAWYEKVPDEENAALAVSAAIREHVQPSQFLSSATLPLAGGPLSPELEEGLAAHLNKNQPVLDKLHDAAKLSKSRYPIDLRKGHNTLLTHLSQIKGLAHLLRYETVFESAQGNRELAVESVISAFGLARTLHNEPTLISELVRIACVAIALDTLERLVSAHQLTPDELRRLDSKLAETENDGTTAMFRAIVGERAGIIDYLTTGQPDLEQAFGTGAPTTNRTAVFQAVTSGARRFLGFQQRDLSLYLGSMEKFAHAATSDFPEAYYRSEQAERELDQSLGSGLGRFAVITRMLVPAINKAIRKEAALVTHLRCARVALAVERHRYEKRGALPATLEDLAPEFIESLPRDPVEDRPFEFRPRAEGGYYISSPAAAAILKNQRSTTFGVFR